MKSTLRNLAGTPLQSHQHKTKRTKTTEGKDTFPIDGPCDENSHRTQGAKPAAVVRSAGSEAQRELIVTTSNLEHQHGPGA